MNNYFVLDVETGGLDESKNAITEVAIVVLDGNTLETLEEYNFYVKPYGELTYEPKALAYTKITMEDINGGREASLIVQDIIALSRKYKTTKNNKGLPIMVAHNGEFDQKFMYTLFALFKQSWFKYVKVFYHDTMEMSQLKWPKMQSINLQSCCHQASIELIGAHKAINDTRATAQLYIHLAQALRGVEEEDTGGGGRMTTHPMHEFRESYKFDF